MKFDPKSTALLIIDMQNDNMSPGGKSEKTGAVEHAKKQNVVEHVAAIADKARSVGVPVFHCIFTVSESAKEVGDNCPNFRSTLYGGSVKRGTWGGAIVDGVQPKDGDYVLERCRMSAFNGTQLDFYLKNLNVKTIIVTGVWSNMAVEHTCRDGADYCYNVVFVTDGTATISEEWQQAAENYAMVNIATKMNTEEVINAL